MNCTSESGFIQSDKRISTLRNTFPVSFKDFQSTENYNCLQMLFMLKVSWRINNQNSKNSHNFHINYLEFYLFVTRNSFSCYEELDDDIRYSWFIFARTSTMRIKTTSWIVSNISNTDLNVNCCLMYCQSPNIPVWERGCQEMKANYF